MYTMNTCLHHTYHTPLHEECPQHDGHKGDPEVTSGTCVAIGERAQVILVWMRALGVENASHPCEPNIVPTWVFNLKSSLKLKL